MAGKGSGLSKPLELSDDLADFMGKAKASRAQVNKKIWDYIKKHDLQDEENRRVIIPDDVLSVFLGSKPIDMFKMATKLKVHFIVEE